MKKHLDASGIRSKCHTRKDGTEHGGNSFFRGALYTILNNPIYRGLISHKKLTFPGDHEAIISEELFQSVQATLSNQGPGEEAKAKRASPALLKGLVFDSKGNRLQPTHSSKHGRKYRYYVSAPMIRNAKSNPHGLRVPASDLERIVINAIATRLRDKKWVTSILGETRNALELTPIIERASLLATQVEQLPVLNDGTFQSIISRVEVSKNAISIKLDLSNIIAKLAPNSEGKDFTPSKNNTFHLFISGQFLRCGKQVRLVLGNDNAQQQKPNARLIQEIVRARRWFADLSNGCTTSITELAKREKCSAPYISLKISLTFLAPDIVQSIVDGTHPRTLTPERLKKACPLPISWEEQRTILLA